MTALSICIALQHMIWVFFQNRVPDLHQKQLFYVRELCLQFKSTVKFDYIFEICVVAQRLEKISENHLYLFCATGYFLKENDLRFEIRGRLPHLSILNWKHSNRYLKKTVRSVFRPMFINAYFSCSFWLQNMLLKCFHIISRAPRIQIFRNFDTTPTQTKSIIYTESTGILHSIVVRVYLRVPWEFSLVKFRVNVTSFIITYINR